MLIECGNTVEATAVKSLLEQNGIEATIHAELADSMLPHLAAVMPPRVMVRAQDLERANALLDALPMNTTEGAGIDGGVCAVHEKPALAICSRCGSFLCEACGSLGEPPVCESCLEAEKLPTRNASPAGPQMVLMVIIIGVVLAVLLAQYAKSR